MTANKNFYQLLGVAQDATKEHIKEAYREIARIFHPDSNFYDEIIDDSLPPEGLDAFKRITEAYNVLIHPEKRREYDLTLPPELKDWGPTERDDFPSWAHEKKSARPVWSSGKGFGTPASEEAAEPTGEPVHEPVHSMAEMIRRRKSITSRILSIFGFD